MQKCNAVIRSKSSQTEIESLSGWKSFQTYVSIPFDRVYLFIFYTASCFHIKSLRLAWHYTFYTIIVFHVNMLVVPWNMVNAFYNFYVRHGWMVKFPWKYMIDSFRFILDEEKMIRIYFSLTEEIYLKS